MSDIKLTIDGTDYEFAETNTETYAFKIPRLLFGGYEYVGKAIQKEKDIPKDWEIISFLWHSQIWYTVNMKPYEIEDCIKKQQIHSVKRLVDNETFSIGDEVKWNWLASLVKSLVIKSFYLDEQNKICVTFTDERAAYQCLSTFPSNMEFKKVTPKPKVPLFTTSIDNVEIFKGDEYYSLQIGNKTFNWVKCRYALDKPAEWETAKSKEKLQEYILLNKPIEVSYNEIEQILLKDYCTEADFHLLLKLFKSKINP